MAFTVKESVDIAQPPEVVWARFGRVEEWPAWFPSMQTVRRVARGPFSIGEPIVLGLALGGRGASITVRVTESAPYHVRWVGSSFGVKGDHAFFVEATATGSRFTSDETLSGLPLLLVPKRYLGDVQQEVLAGMQRFANLFT
jgi:hypothetical protein